MQRITETELILPSLFLMDTWHKGITTSELKEELTKIFKPTGEDAKILDNRKDSKFSQKVRNLKAHNTFERYGYAEYKNGYFFITDKGREFLNKNIDFVIYLLSNGFLYSDLKSSFQKPFQKKDIEKTPKVFDENILIYEGVQKITHSKTYERSIKLRNTAIIKYTENERIKCKICCFDFEDFYGNYGKGFIEIHHQKPVFMFDDNETEQTVKTALENVIPVCSNCHRIIHRIRPPYLVKDIEKVVNKKLYFCK